MRSICAIMNIYQFPQLVKKIHGFDEASHEWSNHISSLKKFLQEEICPLENDRYNNRINALELAQEEENSMSNYLIQVLFIFVL